MPSRPGHARGPGAGIALRTCILAAVERGGGGGGAGLAQGGAEWQGAGRAAFPPLPAVTRPLAARPPPRERPNARRHLHRQPPRPVEGEGVERGGAEREPRELHAPRRVERPQLRRRRDHLDQLATPRDVQAGQKGGGRAQAGEGEGARHDER